MLRTFLAFVLTNVVAGSLLGCHQKGSAPAPACYSGTVVGFDCGNGYLVQVDAQYPIGAPLKVLAADSLQPRPNIIAALNRLPGLNTKGQRIYFTFSNDPNLQSPDWPCTAQNLWLQFPVPHLVLSNVSATPCGATANN